MFLEHLSQVRNQAINQPINQSAYTLFLVHLTYSINKAIIIPVLYRPWHQHCIIWVMVMCWNTSSGVSKSLFWRFRIKDEWNSAVIFFWDTTKGKTKNTQLSYLGMAYIWAIWYILERVLLSNCVFVTRHFASDW